MSQNTRKSWKSHIGFIFAALGSAIGLGSIWRFPYVVGENGGAAFILIYLLFTFIIGYPVLISEIAIGKKTQQNPSNAFKELGKTKFWQRSGKLTIITGFIISSFYSVIAGWILIYFIQSISNDLYSSFNQFKGSNQFTSLCIISHGFFLFLSFLILTYDIQKGIERFNKIFIPLLFFILLLLLINSFNTLNYKQALNFLFYPRFSDLSFSSILAALGHAFFSLSLGQGTMITYGSYILKKESNFKLTLPVVILNILISLLIGIVIFSYTFSYNIPPQEGPVLIFDVLPIIFNKMRFGHLLSSLFFFLVFIAAITSEISALEPMICYISEKKKKITRKKACLYTCLGAFLLGLPSALSFKLLNITFMQKNLFDIISFISINILVPIGGLLSILLIGWKYKFSKMFQEINKNSLPYFYLKLSIKYLSPILIVIILISAFFIY